MNNRRIMLSVLVTTLLLSFASSLVAAAEPLRWRYRNEYDDEIRIEVYAPYEAFPGDKITITVRVEALEDLEGVTIDLLLLDSKNEGRDRWGKTISVIDDEDLDEDEEKKEDFSLTLPSTLDPGIIVGHIFGEWENEEEEWHFEDGFDLTFVVTYLKHKDYEDLKDDYADLSDLYDKLKTDYADVKGDYDSLKATYDSLKSSYDSLKSEHDSLVIDYDALKKKYDSLDSEHKSLLADYEDLESERETTVDELGRFTTYMYVFVVTTVIFVVTTIIFAVRKPRTV